MRKLTVVIKSKIPQLMQDRGITAYQMEKESAERKIYISHGETYRFIRGKPLSLRSIAKAMAFFEKDSIDDIFEIKLIRR
jgi:hypothetical protein